MKGGGFWFLILLLVLIGSSSFLWYYSPTSTPIVAPGTQLTWRSPPQTGTIILPRHIHWHFFCSWFKTVCKSPVLSMSSSFIEKMTWPSHPLNNGTTTWMVCSHLQPINPGAHSWRHMRVKSPKIAKVWMMMWVCLVHFSTEYIGFCYFYSASLKMKR